MPPLKYQDVRAWIKDCRETVRSDLDNLVLLTGPEGQGKSTLELQLARALDPTIQLGQITFGVKEFLETAQGTEKYRVVCADELLVNKRKGMHGTTIRLLDFLQTCRSLNLHLLVCFPHEDLLDIAILNYRVRWKIHIPRRGLWVLSERISRTYKHRNGSEETVFNWVERGKWTFEANTGPFWQAYLAKKEEHVRLQNMDEDEEEFVEDLGFDYAQVVLDLRAVRAQYLETALPRASIQNLPEPQDPSSLYIPSD